jgi:translin
MVKQLNRLLSNYPDLRYGGFTTNALQEYAEAAVFHAIVEGLPIPSPDELEIENTPYALGLGDVVGELRRLVLNKIIENDLKAARHYYKDMEQLTDILFKFHFPDGMIPIRRKQDIARSILEKTQGELAVALTTNAIKNNL